MGRQRCVLPILRHAMLCEWIDVDREGRAHCCVPVHTLRFPPNVERNYLPPTLHAYLQLQEGFGEFKLSVLLRPEREEIDLSRLQPVPVIFDGQNYQNEPMELDIALEGLVIPKPGHYELWVIANYVNLHNPSQQPGWPFPPMRLTAWGADGAEGGVV